MSNLYMFRKFNDILKFYFSIIFGNNYG
jgi:hypothetical protein